MPITAELSAVIGIKLKEEDRQEAGVSVGASGEWREGVGLYGRPRVGKCSPRCEQKHQARGRP